MPVSAMPVPTMPVSDPHRADAASLRPAADPADGDASLLAAARRGDSAAVAELYSRHHAAMIRVARRHTFPDYSAQDLVADAFARMLQALANGRGPDDNAMAYLAVSVRNLSATHGRRRSHRHAPAVATHESLLDVPDPRPGVDHGILTEELQRDLLAALHALPAHWREALVLTHVEELSVTEAARRLDLSPAAFSSLAYRARRALRSTYTDAAQADRPAA